MDLFTYHPENGQMSLWKGTTCVKRNESSSSNHKCSGGYVSFSGGVVLFFFCEHSSYWDISDLTSPLQGVGNISKKYLKVNWIPAILEIFKGLLHRGIPRFFGPQKPPMRLPETNISS